MSMQWCIVTGRSTKLEKLVCHNDLDLKLTFTFKVKEHYFSMSAKT